jgi:quercetin dioxygenase-like cupin family protein
MRSRTLTLVVAGAATMVLARTALATPPSGLKSELLVRGAAGQFRIVDDSFGLTLEARQPTDLALVKATLDPKGSTGWHTHPGQSLVIVKSGTMTTYMPHDGRCVRHQIAAGQAFVHPKGVHNFLNTGTEPLEFYVAYFVPAGAAPLLNDAPAACSG